MTNQDKDAMFELAADMKLNEATVFIAQEAGVGLMEARKLAGQAALRNRQSTLAMSLTRINMGLPDNG